MDRLDELRYKSEEMELDEELYSYQFDTEELPVYQDSGELLVALRQKEEEVILAAELGKALLLENSQLKEENTKLQEQFTDRLEELEQGRHELRVKLDRSRAEWESQVSELERDVRELNGQVERLTQALSDAEREKSQAQQEHSDKCQQLQDQLHTAMEVERVVSAELQNLKQEMRQRGHPRPQDEELIQALREQVACLMQREKVLEQRIETVCQENAELQDTVASLHTQLTLQEQQTQSQIQQLKEARQEVKAAQGRTRELQSKVEELQEEMSLQERSHSDASLLSELEQSLEDTMGWSQDKEQITQEVLSILDLLLPLTQNATEFSNQSNDLRGMLTQLKNVAKGLANGRTLQELKSPIVGSKSDSCENVVRIQELQSQITQLMEENAQLSAQCKRDGETVQQAIKDRDEAIAKKTAVEAELVRSKNDMMNLNNQLLEAIQKKLELSQELEAWQDDIQIIINQQLRTQHQTELQHAQKRAGGNRLSFLRRPRRMSSISSGTPEPGPEQSQFPWKDWLKRSK
ncbi:BICD family-like cargo adapter 1 [Chanos chanos]|uniref:BICD family-like cargo adapter 1 n=1 Tax=Chanos chanos TaxID=29144 RepID=A0A6J2VNE5_CHACN|nr:BICD family-like cargo adapter 1 [Chanos chanos]